MSTREQSTESEAEAETTEEAPAAKSQEGPPEFRAKLAATEEKLGKSQTTIRGAVLERLGVKDGSGMAKAIDSAYQGDWTSIDETVAWAQGEFEDALPNPGQDSAEALAAQESRIDTLRTASAAVDANEFDAQLNKVREAGDVEGSIEVQTAKFYGPA